MFEEIKKILDRRGLKVHYFTIKTSIFFPPACSLSFNSNVVYDVRSHVCYAF